MLISRKYRLTPDFRRSKISLQKDRNTSYIISKKAAIFLDAKTGQNIDSHLQRSKYVLTRKRVKNIGSNVRHSKNIACDVGRSKTSRLECRKAKKMDLHVRRAKISVYTSDVHKYRLTWQKVKNVD